MKKTEHWSIEYLRRELLKYRTVRSFCRKEKISTASFYLWLKERNFKVEDAFLKL